METSDKFQCELCDRLCKSARGLAAHRQTHFTGSTGAENSEAPATKNVTRLLTCHICFRQYKTDRNLQIHLKTHSAGSETPTQTPLNNLNSTPANPDFDEDGFWTDDLIQVFQEEYVDNLPDIFVAEAEEEEASRQNAENEVTAGQQKSKPEKRPALVHCSICKQKKGFDSIDKFLIHRKRHAMQDAYAKAPSLQRAKVECLLLGQETLTKLEQTKLNHPTAQEMKRLATLVKDILFSDSVKSLFESMCEIFMSCFSEVKDFFLISKLTETYLNNVAIKCGDVEVRNSLLVALSPLVGTPLASMLLSSIMRHFSQLLLAFILRVMSQGENGDPSLLGTRYANRTESTSSDEFKQTMHFVGGANIKKILRVSLRLRNPDDKSLAIIDTIRSTFLVVDLAEDTDEVLMAWTESQDRGGLCKINTKVLEFFVQLGRTIQPLERADGSLLASEVIETVSSSYEVISLWDEIIGGKLNGEVSFELLHELVCHFCVTYRNGIISRRLDEWACDQSQKGKSQKHGTGGVSFRARFA